MKNMPKLRPLPTSRKFIDAWGGYDHNAVISENAFYDMKNMSSDLHPIASVRKARSAYEDIGGSTMQDAVALHHRDDWPVVCDDHGNIRCGGHYLGGLLELELYVDAETTVAAGVLTVDETVCIDQLGEGTHIFSYDIDEGDGWELQGEYVDLVDYGIELDGTPDGEDTITVTIDYRMPPQMLPKKIVSMGAWCIIWPDKVWFNAVKLANGDELIEGEDYGRLENTVEIPVNAHRPRTIALKLCDADGEEYDNPICSNTAPEDPEDGAYWIDNSEYGANGTITLKQYSSAMQSWNVISPTYTKIHITYLDEDGETALEEDIAKGFSAGDFIKIDLDAGNNQGLQKIFDKLKERYVKVQKAADHYLVVQFDFNWLLYVGIVSGSFRLECPQMDYVVECGNRLWGCYYGEKNGEHINEIYASKLGDFRNWNTFAGISTDSYVASRGADGKYTGAAVLGDNPLFFREKSFEKVFPASNGAHQIATVHYSGIQEGSWQSPVVIDGTLFYKGTDGVYAYTGSVPRLISEPLGDVSYFDAVAAPLSRKYYISMRDSENNWNLFVFDAERGMWHREENTRFFCACEYKSCLYFLSGDRFGWKIGGVDVSTDVPWMIESGTIGLTTPDQKRVSRIVLRMSLELGAEARIYVQYDGGKWHEKQKMFGNSLRTQLVPIVPIRCDHMKIKMTGIGGMKLFSAAYSVEQGSDMP